MATGRIEDDSKAFIRGILYNHKETSGCILRVQKKKDMLPSTLLSEHEQWGSFMAVASGSVISLPISATPVVAIPVDMNKTNNSLIYSTVDYRNGSFRVYGNRANGDNNLYGTWLAICF